MRSRWSTRMRRRRLLDAVDIVVGERQGLLDKDVLVSLKRRHDQIGVAVVPGADHDEIGIHIPEHRADVGGRELKSQRAAHRDTAGPAAAGDLTQRRTALSRGRRCAMECRCHA
jgi:hypothetical protein